jgi:hypothetical protein
MTEKTVNYTPEMEAALTALAPVTYLEAEQFGLDNDKTTRSVISKVGHMGLDYLKKAVPAKKPHGVTKVELVAEISKRLDGADLEGLEKAPAKSLKVLVDLL